jgi:hypothetical protein
MTYRCKWEDNITREVTYKGMDWKHRDEGSVY